ncbi:MAG: hypothetical protein IVW57_19120, partial [Ktedonobacterales bacterium]|nr:hypothetical protein [Ktedonobacterales bacterium]
VPPTVTPPEGAPPIWPVAEEPPAAPPVWPVSPPVEEGNETLAELAAFSGTAALAATGVATFAMEGTQHPGVAETAAALAVGATTETSPTDTPLDMPPAPSTLDPAVGATAMMAAETAAAETSTAAAGTPENPSLTPLSAGAPSGSGEGGAEPTAPVGNAGPPMKRVRVVRRIVMDGDVVQELVAERIVPADADSQAIAAELREELGHATPEQIAQLAHLPSDAAVEVRARVESGPLSGPLKSPDDQSPPVREG